MTDSLEKVKVGNKFYDKAYIYFETKEVELDDGRILPITNMLTKSGQKTDNPDDALIIQAGKDNVWVNLRLIRESE